MILFSSSAEERERKERLRAWKRRIPRTVDALAGMAVERIERKKTEIGKEKREKSIIVPEKRG